MLCQQEPPGPLAGTLPTLVALCSSVLRQEVIWDLGCDSILALTPLSSLTVVGMFSR